MKTMTTVDKAGNYLKLAQLYAAIKSGERKEFAENIISNGFQINYKIPETNFLKLHKPEIIGCTALHLAFEEDNFTIFKILIEKNADYNLKYNDDTNIVYRAIHKNFNKREILKLKTRFDEFDKDFTLDELNGFIIERRIIDMKDCCKHANWRLWDKFEDRYINEILSACIKSNNITNYCSKNELSYFHAACLTNNLESVEFFLKNGVDVNQISLSPLYDGFTPLHFSVKYSSSTLVGMLLTNGANVFLKNTKGMTPLHILIDQNMKIIDWLHAKSKLPYKNAIDDYIANEEKIKLIMTKYDKADEVNLSCLHVASIMTNTSTVEKLLKENCRVNDRVYEESSKWSGYTSLHFAAHFNIKTVKILVKNGADIEAKDINGLTPLDILITRAKVDDLHFIVYQNKSWNNIKLSDGKTKLLDLLLVMKDLNNFNHFLKNNDANLHIPFNSPLWPGCTILHLAVIFSETLKKVNFFKTISDNHPTDLFTTICQMSYSEQEIYHERIETCLDKNADVTIKDARGWTPINLAFRQRNMSAVKLMLEYHNKIINPIDNDNLSHLHIACLAQTKNVIKKLVSNNADVNLAILPSFKWQSDYYNCVSTDVFDIIGSTPWHLNVQTDDLDNFKILKDAADINSKDGNGLTQLQRMFIIKNLWKICNEWFQVLKSFRCTLIGIRRDELIRFKRALSNDKKIIEELLKSSTESIVKDFGLSNLHIAVYENSIDVVKKLLNAGLNVNLPITIAKKLDVNHPLFLLYNFEGYTPLQMDINNRGYAELEKIFIERGSDVLTKRADGMNRLFDNLVSLYTENVALFVTVLKQDNAVRKRLQDDFGWTLLHIACQLGDFELAKESVSNGVDINFQINIDSPIYPGCTALHILMMRYHEIRQCDNYAQDFLMLLLDNNADVMLADFNGNTPLHWSNVDARRTIVSYTRFHQAADLLQRIQNFKVNPVNNEGISVFHIACIRHDVETVRRFLEQGVDVNQPIEFINEHFGGCTPLHLTAKNRCSLLSFGYIEFQRQTIELLLENGAYIYTEDVFGNTPLHAAAECESPKDELLRRLVENGARIRAENVYGKTPLESLLSSCGTTRLELEFFLHQGCNINSFNRITQSGYIPLLFDHGIKGYEALRLALNYASENVDFKLRTALHNIASIPRFLSEKNLRAIEYLIKKGCHIDQQDRSGKTALHLAAQFRNDIAIEGLLTYGADVNITDHAGKTAFAYTLETESLCDLIDNGYFHDHHLVINIFARYLYHMKLRGNYVNDLNRQLLTRVFNTFNIKEKPIARSYMIIRNIRIGHTPFTLDDFLCETKAIVYYFKIPEDDRKIIEEFFKRSVYEYPFEDWTFLCILQYKKALARGKLVASANDAINILLGFPFPELCFEIVEKFLTHDDLKNMIKASTLK